MISEDDLAKNERDSAYVITNPKEFSAQIWDAAKAISELCASIRKLQVDLVDCRELRDSWCAAYTELRDQQKSVNN